jgi:asparagine synthase (glutamine-hydrolysing)
MCGILGQVNISKNHKSFCSKNFSDALGLMDHRGPDNHCFSIYSTAILGHRRLSIIDLDIKANQPMTSTCGQYVITFNGEIYNYKELREKLIYNGYVFCTTSDTEVLLYSFAEYGIDCIKDLIGMFSFCIYDKIKNEFYIVRDRLGVKPLYYTIQDEVLTFSSEIKSILHFDVSPRNINKIAVSSYLSFRYPIMDDTFFDGIKSLSPAHYIKISNNNYEISEYWNVTDKFSEQKNDRGEEYYLEKLRGLLESSINYRMVSDVPIGSYLSGGVDSSVITAVMTNSSEENLKTFTIGFTDKGFNEFEYADIVAKLYETDHKEIILSSNDYLKYMKMLINFKDAPLSVPNEVALYLMSKELKKDITVVLSGEGADELFGGYGRIFRSPWDLERIKSIDKLKLPKDIEKTLAENFFKKYGAESFSTEIDHFNSIYSYTSFLDKKRYLSDSFEIERIEEILLNKFLYHFNELENETYSNKIFYAFEKIHLVGLLQRVDVATMATSVEARVPFVDHRLVEFAFTIPLKYKLKWKNQTSKSDSITLMSNEISEQYDVPKYILKKAYEHILPKEILYRKKVGFPVPLNEWFGGDFLVYARDVLLSDEAISRGVIDTTSIEDLLNVNVDEFDFQNGMLVWMLINLELFFKSYKLQLKK